MVADNLIQQAESHILHTYNRFPVVLDHGEGVYLFDIEGNKYLDFAAGIAGARIWRSGIQSGVKGAD